MRPRIPARPQESRPTTSLPRGSAHLVAHRSREPHGAMWCRARSTWRPCLEPRSPARRAVHAVMSANRTRIRAARNPAHRAMSSRVNTEMSRRGAISARPSPRMTIRARLLPRVPRFADVATRRARSAESARHGREPRAIDRKTSRAAFVVRHSRWTASSHRSRWGSAPRRQPAHARCMASRA